MPLLLATNLLLLALAGVALARLLRAVFPGPRLALERALVVAALLVDPAVLAGMVQPNVDFGVLVFLLCATAALVEGRRSATIAFGLLTAFSKETGALLYGGLLFAWWLADVLPRPVGRDLRNALVAGLEALAAGLTLLPWATWTLPVALVIALLVARVVHQRPFAWGALGAAARRALSLAPLAIPLAIYAAYLAGRALLAPNTSVLWGALPGGLVLRFLLSPQVSAHVRTYLALIFVVNFHWVIGGVIAAAMLAGAIRQVQWRRVAPAPDTVGRLVRFVAILAAVETYLVTRISTAILVRYTIPVYPVMLTLFLASLLRLRVAPAARRGLLAALPLLFAVSARRTVDPISRTLWATLPIGRHDVLYVSSLVQTQIDAFGPDESVYNLELLGAMPSLVQSALDRLHPVRQRVLVMADGGDWHTVGAIDARSQRRLWGPGLVEPAVLAAGHVAASPSLPDSAWFVEVPWAMNADALRSLARRYTIGPPDTLWTDGYAIVLRRLDRRPAAAAGAIGVQ
jgi:hypothetical protein